MSCMRMCDGDVWHDVMLQYIRDKRRGRRGVMVGVIDTFAENPTVRIGFSMCNKKDRFNSEIGTTMAYLRANKWVSDGRSPNIPSSVAPQIKYFAGRCAKYFRAPVKLGLWSLRELLTN